MNYELLYKTLVEKFKTQIVQDGTYTEKHHVVPRHAGGSDDPDNLIIVTYRQHCILHKVRYKAYKQDSDLVAYRLMYGIAEDRKKEICSLAGRKGGKRNVESGHIAALIEKYAKLNGLRNVESGHLDRIRLLANNEKQRSHASSLGKKRRDNGELLEALAKAHIANRERVWTEEQRLVASVRMKKLCSDNPEIKERFLKMLREQSIVKAEKSNQFSQTIISGEVDEIWLYKKSSRSLNFFVSPEGLMFESPLYAAKYYMNRCEPYIIENWCKREMNGWRRVPKPVVD